MAARRDELARTTALFWHCVQQRRLVATAPRLSVRERETLGLIARGFAIAEVAERQGVSQRAAEKFAAGARGKLGARNNAQAIYRGMVYRALT